MAQSKNYWATKSLSKWQMADYAGIVATPLMAEFEIAEAVNKVAPGRNPADFKYQLNENWVKYRHIEAMFDFETFAPLFYKRIWRFGINSTDEPFWTSDNPVVLINQDGESRDVFLADRGSCVTFPLSPFVVLLMYDDGVFNAMSELDGKPMHVPSDLVAILNRAQHAQSRRIVMSAKPFHKQLLQQLTNNVSVE